VGGDVSGGERIKQAACMERSVIQGQLMSNRDAFPGLRRAPSGLRVPPRESCSVRLREASLAKLRCLGASGALRTAKAQASHGRRTASVAKDSRTSKEAQDRAEASFKRKELQADEGKKAAAEYAASGEAMRAKTARLRQLRLAKEAAEQAAAAKEAAGARPKKKG
jgi:hypothetical protein